MNIKDNTEETPTYRVTVDFTDGSESVTASGIDGESVSGLYSILGDEGSRARLWTVDDRLVMFPGKYIRRITATEEKPEPETAEGLCYVRHEVAPGAHMDIPHTHEDKK